jgi:hypothetical protein
MRSGVNDSTHAVYHAVQHFSEAEYRYNELWV